LYAFLAIGREEIEAEYGSPAKRASRIADYSVGDVAKVDGHDNPSTGSSKPGLDSVVPVSSAAVARSSQAQDS
jgi:hypothetical protein